MPNQLDLPDDLLPLIEKRDQTDRRDAPSAADGQQPSVVGPPDGIERRKTPRRDDDGADYRVQ